MKENSKGKNLCDNEMESITGGIKNDVHMDPSKTDTLQKIGDPIYERCSWCGERIITGYYGKNTAPPRHICGLKM